MDLCQIKKRGLILLVLLLIPLVSANLRTQAVVESSAPELIGLIPNQSWAACANNSDAFDLDNYFLSSGNPLNYSFSDVENLSVVIGPLNLVSFYPACGFFGNRDIVFFAFDGRFNTSSNPVGLSIGQDNESPQWFNLSVSKANIYQNSYVIFNTSWTDNVGLKRFIFSINQEDYWENYSYSFSGRSNTSSFNVQIRATPGSFVRWKFYAFDLSNNFNETEVQTIRVLESGSPLSSTLRPESNWDTFLDGEPEEVSRLVSSRNFSLSQSSFLISMKQGTGESRTLRITNTGNGDLSFDFSISGLKSFIKLGKKSSRLLPGESDEITLDFLIPEGTLPDQYFWALDVRASNGKVVKIPIVINVYPLDLIFELSLNVRDNGNLLPGELVFANVSIINKKDIKKRNLIIYSAVKDLYGNIYSSDMQNLSLEDFLSFQEALILPDREGEYLFYSRAYDGLDSSFDSELFIVGFRSQLAAFFKSYFIFVMIGVLSFLAIILFFRYRQEKERDRLLTVYLMINELKKSVKKEDYNKALEIYKRIKAFYGEPIKELGISDREKLKAEIQLLIERLSGVQKNSDTKIRGESA